MNETTSTKPQLLPLDSWHRAQGARMVPFAGYEMPIQYEGIVAEHNWTRTAAGLFDVSHMGQLGLSGPGGDADAAAEALEALVPGDISRLGEGRMRYSLLLNAAGGVLDDLIITRTRDSIGVVVNGAVKADDIAHLRATLADSITLTHYTDHALLAVQGPEAARVMAGLVPGCSELTFMSGAAFEWEGAPLWISRSGYTGEDGFEIGVPAKHVEALASALVSDSRVKPIGLGARDSLRLEAGLPLYGHDLTPETDPVSASLTFALSKSRRESGGWIGHGPVMQTLKQGPRQRRIGLMLEGRLPAREGALVYAGDHQVGRVTSGGFAPTLKRPIAMGYVDTQHAKTGTRLDIEVRGKRLPAAVTSMPFVEHKYYRGS